MSNLFVKCISIIFWKTKDVILPLAASTNALILANAIPGDCALSGALSRAFKLQRSKWGKIPPFTILSIAGSTPRLYLNPNQNAHWHTVRAQSRSWSARHDFILQTIQTHGYFRTKLGECDCSHDLDPDAKYLVLVDSVRPSGEGFTTNPSQYLRTELVRFLASTLPSFVMKTGHAEKFANDEKTFQACLDQANAGMELLFLDLRKRQPVDSGQSPPGCAVRSQAYIDAAWQNFQKTCDDLRAKGLCDSLDASSVAYAHQFLVGKLDQENVSGVTARDSAIPLHQAIASEREDRWAHRISSENDLSQKASEEQVVDIAQRLARRIYQDWAELTFHGENMAFPPDFFLRWKNG